MSMEVLNRNVKNLNYMADRKRSWIGFELSIAIIIIKHDDEFYLRRWNIIVCMSFIVNWALITPILFFIKKLFFAALFCSVKFSFDFNL